MVLSAYTDEKQWLFLFFIHSAFGCISQTEVLAFQFRTGTAMSWYVPWIRKTRSGTGRIYYNDMGGLCSSKNSLLSDMTREMSRTHGVFVDDPAYWSMAATGRMRPSRRGQLCFFLSSESSICISYFLCFLVFFL